VLACTLLFIVARTIGPHVAERKVEFVFVPVVDKTTRQHEPLRTRAPEASPPRDTDAATNPRAANQANRRTASGEADRQHRERRS